MFSGTLYFSFATGTFNLSNSTKSTHVLPTAREVGGTMISKSSEESNVVFIARLIILPLIWYTNIRISVQIFTQFTMVKLNLLKGGCYIFK